MKASIRKINDHTVTVSIPYKIMYCFNFGARMLLINFDKNIVIYSPIQYDEGVFNQALKVLFETETIPPYEIKYIIASNDEHNLFSHQYKEKFGCKIIAGENCKLKNNCKIDYPLTTKIENKIIKGSLWQEDLDISEPFMKNLELMYLGKHLVRDVEVFDNVAKTLYVGDLVTNLGIPGTTNGKVVLEQYSPEVGFQKGYNPHGWTSFFTRYLQPNSTVCRYLANYAAATKTEEGKNAIKGIETEWDFDKIVMNHGNVIEKDGQETWRKLFGGYV